MLTCTYNGDNIIVGFDKISNIKYQVLSFIMKWEVITMIFC
jgi:hypothetical protein